MSENMSASELERLAKLLESGLPDLRSITPLRFVDQGFRSIAVETAGGVLMRIGTSAEAAADYELEMQALPFVAKHIDAAIPVPEWYVTPNRDLPHGVLGYPMLPGTSPKWEVEPPERFTLTLGRFLAQLHSTLVDQAIKAGISKVNTFQRLIGAEDVVLPVLRDKLSAPEIRLVQAWW